MRRLPATGLIALLGCTVPAEIPPVESPQVPKTRADATGEPEPQPWPEPTAEPIDFPRGEPIVAVEQFGSLRKSVDYWSLDPQGRWLAEAGDDGCDLWDIETGLRLGAWTELSVSSPCQQWPPPEIVIGYEPSSSFDGALTASVIDADIEIYLGDNLLRTLACRGCANVDEYDWEPRGHRLAVAREGGRLEVWDAYTGDRRATISKHAPLGKGERLVGTQLGWSVLGVMVLYGIERPQASHTQIQLWSESGLLLHEWLGDPRMDSAYIDPTRQWLLVLGEKRLAVHSLAGRQSALAWVASPRSERAVESVAGEHPGIESLIPDWAPADVPPNTSTLPVDYDVVDAALSPDGERVAVLGEDRVRIFAVESGTLLVRFIEPDANHLAFAQDGRLLFTGASDAPELAWNSWTGEPVPDGLVGLRDGTLDPTWRWLVVGHDRVVRVVDGLALNLGSDWAMLDDGRFAGTPPLERTRDRTFRVGEALAVPNCSFADLERWLHRPQLLEDFFAGRPIAPAVVPIAEVEHTKCTIRVKP
jgi:WD40 repeat protein